MSTKTFEEGKKFSRRSWRVLLWGFSARNGNEIQTNCRVEFDVKKNKNKKLVGSYLRCAYNHVLLEKNFTALSNSLFNTSKIEDLFWACALSSPVTFPTGNNRIWPSASSIRDLRLWDGLGSLKSISNKKKSYGLNWSQIGLISESDLNVNEAYSGAQLEKENMKNPSVPRPSLRWLRDQERLERFWRVGSF